MRRTLLFKLALAASFSPAAYAGAGIGELYGTRDPSTCPSRREPERGAITAAQAIRYMICENEEEVLYGPILILIDDVKMEVGKSRLANPLVDRMIDIDYDSPVYPIRGSFSSYRCKRLVRGQDTPGRSWRDPAPNEGRSCTRAVHAQALGRCIRTTFGDWRCDMRDPSPVQEDNVPPPAR